MKVIINMKSIRTLFLIYLVLVLGLSGVESQITVFPDSLPTFDNVFTSDITNTFLYSAGYFTASSTKLSLSKQGIILSPYSHTTYCYNDGGSSYTPTVLSSDTTTRNNVVTSSSELYTAFQNTLYNTASNSGLRCKFPISSSGSTYVWTGRIPIYNSSGSSATLSVQAIPNSTGSGSDIFAGAGPSIASSGVYMLTVTVTATSANNVSVKATGAAFPTALDTSAGSFLWLWFKLNSASSDVKLTYFIFTLNTSGSSLTQDGSSTCSGSNPCLEGYTCVGSTCLKCHASCLTCSLDAANASASTACLTCQRHTAGWKAGPTSGSCSFDYVDLSQYNDITVSTIEPPRTNRVTLSFWTFVSDLSKFNTSAKVVNFSLQNFLVLSLYGNSSTSVGLYCAAYQKLKPNVETQTTVIGLAGQLSDTTSMINMITPGGSQAAVSLNGKWFYAQCAMSFDHQQFFLNTSVDGVDYNISKALPHEKLFASPLVVYNDFYFKSGYRSGDYLNLKIKGASNITTKIYVKNLYIFREFIPYDMHYMHFNIHKIVSSASDWPELLYSLGFDSFTFGGTFTLASTSYVLPTTTSAVTITLTPISTPSLYAPINFKRLDLVSTTNTQWATADLSSTSSITAGTAFIAFNNSKAMTCNSGSWLDLTNYTCSTSCASTNTMYAGITGTKGYCNYPCTGSMNCPYTGAAMSNLTNNFTCNASSTNVFFSCLSTTLPNYSYFYYNSFYNPSNIYLDNTKLTNFKSYIMEVWYMPDNTMSSTNFVTTSAPSFANYIFYSNSMAVFINASNSIYYLQFQYNASSPTSLSGKMNSFEWNRLIFNVLFDGTNYNLQFYIGNPLTTTPITASTTTNQSLSYILFCHLDVSNCAGNTIYWASGLYKNMRIWNGDLAQPNSLWKYDDLYPSTFANRAGSISLYYPLNLGYIANNVISDPGNSANNYSITNTYNGFNFQGYNYGTNTDYIQANSLTTTYMSNILSQVVTTSSCNSACNRCYGSSSTNCYLCSTGYFMYGSTCMINSSGKYFFTSPSSNATPNDLQFKTYGSNVTPMGTITFWAKVLGFASSNSDMIYYGANLKLAYDSTNFGSNTNYGLSLIFTSSSTYLAKEPNFRLLLGKWTFFSIAYYDGSTSSYFPAMLKFEINSTSYSILSTNITSLSISQFLVSKSLYGLVANVKAYSTYIIGAYGYETNTATPNAPFSKPTPFKTYLAPGSNNSNCLSAGSDTNGWTDVYTCSVDYDFVFDTSAICTTNTKYYTQSTNTCTNCPSNPVTAGTGCSTMCMGNTKNAANTILTSCTCQINNFNSSMIIKNNNQNVCYRFDYVNFAKVDTITLTNVPTAKATQKYTLQFWIFAYNYVANTFGGVTFSWNYHNKVDIYYSGGYLFKCSPFYDSSNSSFQNSESHTLAFTINAWNYISCAVDTTTMFYYMNTETLSFSKQTGVSVPSGLTANTVTTLKITENTSAYSDWGVLFFRQIRLWIDSYTSAGFLSRVNIQTPALFPNAIGIWDPIYSGTNQIVDLTTNAPTLALTYSASVLGSNVVDDTIYSTLFMCSENGEYFDSTSNACVQFTDLSNVSNFQINGIASSYTGDYTMEFWIFVEDYTDVTSGANVIWQNHVAVSILKTTSLTGYCFPQGYYDDLTNTVGTDITTKFQNAKNAFSVTLTSSSGQWIWVRCAVSNYNQIYYLNSSGNQVLNPELLYDSTRNNYPFRYYFPNSTTSTLFVQNIGLQTKKVYLRSIYLFKDFLPITYLFKYMDLSNIGQNYFPSLVFASNFANFATNQLKYSLYEYGFASTINASVTVTVAGGSTFALAANFVQMPLCDPKLNLKYDSSSNTCIAITNCVKASLNAWYCYDESSPLTCFNNNYYNMGSTPPACTGQCPTGIIKTPGAVLTNAICNTTCDPNILSCPNGSVGLLSALPANFACQNNFNRINYHCTNTNLVTSSAMFFSRCYNSPNVYRDLSVTSTSKLLLGHIYEFWFKIDNVLNSCIMATTNEYYLYSPPHTIYRDTTTNIFYYAIYNTAYKGALPSIQKYEWNRIMIKTTINSGVQSVYIFVNYGLTNPDFKMTNIPAANNMQLATISFCSKQANGNCLNSGPSNIEWGSAYYRNIRVWDVTSATESLVQSYNNGLFSENLKSLVLFYPLTIDKLDVNKISNIVGNYDNIVYTVNYSGTNRLFSADNFTLVNYSTNFDWGGNNLGSYITSMSGTTVASGTCSVQCKRCYSSSSTACYECNTGFVLKGQTCINVTNYYLKVPVTNPSTPVALKITSGTTYDMTKATSFTMTFWIKFFGINSTSSSSTPAVVSLSPNTLFAYDTASKNLLFTQNSVTAFISTNWTNYIGQWVLITFSNYISNAKNSYYPNMISMSVNQVDLPMQATYSIPASGVPITQVLLGFEIVALFAEFRFYSNFFEGAYGLVTSSATRNTTNMIFMISLSGNSPSNCISDSDLASGTVSSLRATCIGDYNPFLDTLNQCNDDTKYLDTTLSSITPPCASCNSNCHSLCFNSASNQCTCDLTQGYYWLRRDQTNKQAYCDAIPNIDFSTYTSVSFPTVKGSKTLESTLEFWAFVYSYNTGTNQFSQIDITWNMYNKVTLYNQSNSLNSKCYVLYDTSNPARYSETISLTLTYYKWNIIRCGTDLRNTQFFYNSVLNKMQTTDIPVQPATTTLSISMPDGAITNFGFVFIRELKLWQQFNYKFIDTSFINISNANYPGLLHYFKNTYDRTVVNMQDTVNASTFVPLTRRTDFIGYNFIDPSNTGLWTSLLLCNEGQVYNPTTLTCITPTTTKCLYPGNINDDCITCPSTTNFIDANSGLCVSTCLPNWFGNKNINQCRQCDASCNQCSDIWNTSCTACAGNLYFVSNSSQCVSTCETFGLTMSLTTPNLCVVFDASATLVNVSPSTLINPNTFNQLVAQVIGATSQNYTTLWAFNSTASQIASNNNTIVYNPSGPFNSSLTNLAVSLNPSFFQLGFKYNFILNIIKTKSGSSVTIYKNWTLTMNHAPTTGLIKVTPTVGLINTTTFVINCLNWLDDNTVALTYKYYSIENNTNTVNLITNWTSATETFTNFTVRYYQLPSTTIQVYCDVMDSMGAVTTSTTTIKIVNSLSSAGYNLTAALQSYSLPSGLDDNGVLARSEYLKSLGINPYKVVQPKLIRTEFAPSCKYFLILVDNSIVTQNDPTCTSDYCNGNGYCDLVDISIACNCVLGYLGNNCQIDKNGYPTLASSYQNLYSAININIAKMITYNQLKAMWNLYFAASNFFQDPSFFSSDLNTFMTLAQSSYMPSVINNTAMYFDFYDFYYSYTSMRLYQQLILNRNQTNYPFRNVTLTISQQSDFAASFADISKGLNNLITNIITTLGTTSQTIVYSSSNLYIAIAQLTPVFNETQFFSSRISAYKSWATFMSCINYIEITRLNNPYYVAWFAFVEYQTMPFSYNPSIYTNNTAPLVDLFFIDALTGKKIIVQGCDSTPITFYLPFTSYKWVNQLNAQKSLYDPNNYKAPDDPIFSSPIYINSTGFVSNDTIQDRINLYHRQYNLSCSYYDATSQAFLSTGVNYTNFTSNFIAFNTSHLTQFSTFFIQNDVTYNVDGRFFYLSNPQILLHMPNYWTNFAWFTIFALLCFFVLSISILTCCDYKYFQQESLLEFLKKEILKAHSPYEQKIDFNVHEIMPMDNQPNGERPYEDYIRRKSKVNPAREEFEVEDSNNRKDMLNLNDNNDDGGFKIAFDDDEPEEPKGKRRSIFEAESIDIREDKTRKEGGDDFSGKDEKGGMNNFLNYADKGGKGTFGNVDMLNGDKDPADPLTEEENEEEEYDKRIEAFANLNLSVCQFMCWNLKQRHVMIAPLINMSVFNPRYKKLTLFITECAIMMLIITVQITNDTTTRIDFSSSPIVMNGVITLVKYSFIAAVSTNFVLYMLAVFFRTSLDQRRRLHKIVTSGAQLLILKEWEEMSCTNSFFTVIGMIINITLWVVSFYFSLTYVAVWKDFAWTWLLGFIIAFIMDVVLFEFLFEWFISVLYWKRRTSQCSL